MPKKKIVKKEVEQKISKLKKICNSPVCKASVKVPIIWAIIFSLLLAGTSLAAGVVLMKVKLKVVGPDTAKLVSKNIFEATKINKPQLDFYVMSFCPYGNQIEETLRPIFDLLGNKVELRPRYIFEKIEGSLATYCKARYTIPYDPNKCADYVAQSQGQLKDIADCKQQIAAMVTQATAGEKTCNDEKSYLKIGNNLYSSLHGRIEANQDVREICAYNIATDKKLWWDFIKNANDNCTSTNADTCWEEQAKKAGLDTNKITECFNKEASALIEKEIADTTKYKIQGSPSLMIGDKPFPPEIAATAADQNIKIGNKVYSANQLRSQDVIKEALCSAFKNAPKECKKSLEVPAAVAPAAVDAAAAPAAVDAAAPSCN